MKEFKDSILHLLLYFDDIILAGPSIECVEDCKKELLKEFDMKDKGNLKYFLGLDIDYDRKKGVLKIKQERYLEEILKCYNLENYNPCLTPIESSPTLYSNKGEQQHKPVKE